MKRPDKSIFTDPSTSSLPPNSTVFDTIHHIPTWGRFPALPSKSSRTDQTESIYNTQLIGFKRHIHRKPLIMGGSHHLPPHQYPPQFITFITAPPSPAPPAATLERLRRPI